MVCVLEWLESAVAAVDAGAAAAAAAGTAVATVVAAAQLPPAGGPPCSMLCSQGQTCVPLVPARLNGWSSHPSPESGDPLLELPLHFLTCLHAAWLGPKRVLTRKLERGRDC